MAALAAAPSWGCVATPPPPAAPAKLSVEVLRGARQAPPAATPAPAAPQRVEILLDLTPSMKTRTSQGPTRLAAARAAATRLARALPAESEVTLYGYGFTTGTECAPGARLAAAEQPREYLLERVAQTGAYTEGSLADALDAVRVSLAAADALESAQVVVLTDLEPGCEGDPCAAALSLVEAGVRIDLVVVGEAEVPACFELLAPDSPPRALDGVLPDPRALRFTVESVEAPDVPSVGPRATRRADGSWVALPSGNVALVVGLEPPYAISPVSLPPHTMTRIRVLDFPGGAEPVREWERSVHALPTGSGAAAPRDTTR